MNGSCFEQTRVFTILAPGAESFECCRIADAPPPSVELSCAAHIAVLCRQGSCRTVPRWYCHLWEAGAATSCLLDENQNWTHTRAQKYVQENLDRPFCHNVNSRSSWASGSYKLSQPIAIKAFKASQAWIASYLHPAEVLLQTREASMPFDHSLLHCQVQVDCNEDETGAARVICTSMPVGTSDPEEWRKLQHSPNAILSVTDAIWNKYMRSRCKYVFLWRIFLSSTHFNSCLDSNYKPEQMNSSRDLWMPSVLLNVIFWWLQQLWLPKSISRQLSQEGLWMMTIQG